MSFLAFEGIDGSGKTTLIQKLKAHLKEKNIESLLTREPGGTKLAEEIRHLLIRTDGEAPVPRAELLLYEAARAQHVDKVILPALKDGIWVLCDRFYASTTAFQSAGRSIDQRQVDWLNSYAINGCEPEAWVLLDLTVEESAKRMSKRNNDHGSQLDRFELEKSDFHNKVRNSYLEQAKSNPEKWIILDATLTPDEVYEELLKQLQTKGLL